MTRKFDIEVNVESYRSADFKGLSLEELETMLEISARNGYSVTVLKPEEPETAAEEE